MAKLAIKGHATRGKEVIEILEMLGGFDKHNYCADCNSLCFYVCNENNVIYYDWVNSCYEDEDTFVFALEEFLEKFPYKVGDKVLLNDIVKTIKQARWDSIDNEVIYKIETNIRGFSEEYYVHYYDLQPYKEETMEEIKIDIQKGYEFFGVDDDNQQVVFTKIGYHYPNTYEECFNICFGNKHHIIQVVGLDGLGDNKELFESFIKLKICRDAYWKIAGDWKYDVNKTEEYFYIVNKCGRVVKEHYMNFNHILAFPTEEMRDAFYENFKELIQQCKELL